MAPSGEKWEVRGGEEDRLGRQVLGEVMGREARREDGKIEESDTESFHSATVMETIDQQVLAN